MLIGGSSQVVELRELTLCEGIEIVNIIFLYITGKIQRYRLQRQYQSDFLST
jgi:hypothetical protein